MTNKLKLISMFSLLITNAVSSENVYHLEYNNFELPMVFNFSDLEFNIPALLLGMNVQKLEVFTEIIEKYPNLELANVLFLLLIGSKNYLIKNSLGEDITPQLSGILSQEVFQEALGQLLKS